MATKTSGSKALQMMQKNKSVNERAADFEQSIKRQLQRDIIDPLIDKRDRLKDTITELSDFSLNTDRNAGVQALTREQCTERFKKIFEAEKELKFLELELQVTTDSFSKYFE